jgi:hypothetical protein
MNSSAKRIPRNSIIGEQGIALIHQRVLEMGYLWYPTGGLEAGIDGVIELRDPSTGTVTNSIVQVQSKATEANFEGETDQEFFYVCEERDLDYWLNGNAPVILVRSRPRTNEAYWMSIKDYFRDPLKRKSRKIVFHKGSHRFDLSAQQMVWNLAVPKDAGIFRPPLPNSELLYPNLLPLLSYAETLYVAESEYRFPGQIWSHFKQLGVKTGSEWFLNDGRIYSFRPLDEAPFTQVCDQGTVEQFGTEEWATSDSIERQREFVRLMNRCLSEKLFRLGVKFDKENSCYFFRSTDDLTPRYFRYTSLNNRRSSRCVFKGYTNPSAPEKVSYYRHSAFEGKFIRFDDGWHLQITPTYRFTWDGNHLHGSSHDNRTGIQRLERNGAVVGQLVMWTALLSRQSDLFNRYPYLEFGQLRAFRIGYGIDDEAWLPKEDNEEASNLTVNEEVEE